MKLLESAWDGDIEGVRCTLNAGVPVDVQIFVRSMQMDVCVYTLCSQCIHITLIMS